MLLKLSIYQLPEVYILNKLNESNICIVAAIAVHKILKHDYN